MYVCMYVGRELETPGPIDRTPETPGSGKNGQICHNLPSVCSLTLVLKLDIISPQSRLSLQNLKCKMEHRLVSGGGCISIYLPSFPCCNTVCSNPQQEPILVHHCRKQLYKVQNGPQTGLSNGGVISTQCHFHAGHAMLLLRAISSRTNLF